MTTLTKCKTDIDYSWSQMDANDAYVNDAMVSSYGLYADQAAYTEMYYQTGGSFGGTSIYNAGNGTADDPHTGMSTASLGGYLNNVASTGDIGSISGGVFTFRTMSRDPGSNTSVNGSSTDDEGFMFTDHTLHVGANQGGYPVGLQQFIAIVVSESSNNLGEARAIGSTMINRILSRATSLDDPNFLKKISANGNINKAFKGYLKPVYNDIMAMTMDQLLNCEGPYETKIQGALDAFNGLGITDYSNGAYFWNATHPSIGVNWNDFNSGIFLMTLHVGQTTFFKYNNYNDAVAGSVWP